MAEARGNPIRVVKINLCNAHKIRVEYEENGQPLPCPLTWLGSFSMRSFTNATVFDDTLPVCGGRMEIGSAVSIDQLKDAMEDWFRRESYLPNETHLMVTGKV